MMSLRLDKLAFLNASNWVVLFFRPYSLGLFGVDSCDPLGGDLELTAAGTPDLSLQRNIKTSQNSFF